MSYFPKTFDPKVKSFLDELQELLGKHQGEMVGQFAIHLPGDISLYDLCTVTPTQVECWGQEKEEKQSG